MATFNAKVVSASVSAETGVVHTTIELRVAEADPVAVASFEFHFRSDDDLTKVKAAAKARAIAEWNVYTATLARQTAADALIAGLVGLSFNIQR